MIGDGTALLVRRVVVLVCMESSRQAISWQDCALGDPDSRRGDIPAAEEYLIRSRHAGGRDVRCMSHYIRRWIEINIFHAAFERGTSMAALALMIAEDRGPRAGEL